MIESLKTFLPWLSELPTPTKVIVSLIIVLLAMFLLLTIWLPTTPIKSDIEKNKRVLEAYQRLQRGLSRLTISKKGRKLIDGEPIEEKLVNYYDSYFELQTYIKDNPNDVNGTYEKIWDLGGGSRPFIDNTNSFETVVSAFFYECEEAKRNSSEQ